MSLAAHTLMKFVLCVGAFWLMVMATWGALGWFERRRR